MLIEDRIKQPSFHFFATITDNKTGKKEIKDLGHNIIVDQVSLLIAQLLKNESPNGITHMAIGSGDGAWDITAPPAPIATATTLENEINRKAIATYEYIDSSGNPTPTRTNIVDYTATWASGEGNGTWLEVGLFGGTGASAPDGGDMINWHTFPALIKAGDITISLTWRITT